MPTGDCEQRTMQFDGLGTAIKLSVFGECDDAAMTAASALVSHEEQRLTVNKTHSEVMRVNQAAGRRPVTVSSATYTLIAKAVQASREGYGFNALVGPVVKLWRIGFADAAVPADADIADSMPLTDPTQVSLNPHLHEVMLLRKGMELDLGGIAKGYIADRIRLLWLAYGIRAGIIDLGGNLLFVGNQPNRRSGEWVIGIQDPHKHRHGTLGSVVMAACSAVTSGIYERFLLQDGHVYHHLIDPHTGYPLDTPLAGVTVFTRNSLQGELEAKRLFFAGSPVPGWLDEPDHLAAVFVYRDGEVKAVGTTLLKNPR